MLAIILENLYKHELFFFSSLNAGNLKNPGIKYIPKGYTIDIAKLAKVSFIKIFCVFSYTAQKHAIKYQ